MKRIALLLTCAVMLAGSGCCGHRNNCGPCGGGYSGGYGAGYSPMMQQPMMMQPNCPSGNCGMYQGASVGGTTSAYVPYTTTASTNYLPVY